jgi:flagellar motor switch protein FliN/FliY
MSKDYLSQEEIDALLRQSADASSALFVDDYLTPLEQDALGEIGNITFGSAATALSTLLGKKVDITTPKVTVIGKADVASTFPDPHVAVHVNYSDGFQGINLLVIKTIDAQVIADLMLGGTGHPIETELNEIHVSAVQEAMNQMMGSSATSMSTIFNRFINISPPGIDVLDFTEGEGRNNFLTEDVFIQVSFRLIIGDLIDSNIMQLLPVWFAKDMVSILMGGNASNEVAAASTAPAPKAAAPAAAPAPAPMAAQQAPTPAAPQTHYSETMHQPPSGGGYPPAMHQPPMHQQPPYAPPYGGVPMHQPSFAAPNRNIQSAQFTDFSGLGSPPVDNPNLNLLLDIPLKVTVELGRTHKQIKDILELSQGSIVELDKLAGEPVDILVNNKLIAKGEVVVIDENFGVRVTDIVSPWDRIQKLQ